jgi:hypothetical protein
LDGCDDNQEGAISEPDRRQGQRMIIRIAAFLTVGSVCIQGTVCSLFLLELKATTFEIGLLAMLIQMGALAQIPSLALITRWGKVGLFVRGRLACLVPFAMLLFLAVHGGTGPFVVWSSMGAFAILFSLLAAGNTSWWPLLQDNLAGDAVGEFFARMRTKLRAIEVILPLLIGWYLGAHPASVQFLVPFAVALTATMLSAWYIMKVPERPAAGSRLGLFRRLLHTARVASVRRYVLFLFVRTMVLTLSTPFWVVVLTARGLPVSYMVWLGALAALGNVIGLRQWGRLVDRHGSRCILGITLIPEAILGLTWLALPSSNPALFAFTAGFYLLWGFLEGGYFIAQTHAMMEAVPVADQNEGFALAGYAGALAGMVGGFLGGCILQRITNHPAGLFGMDGRLVYLAGIQFCTLGIWWTSRRLANFPEQTSAREVMHQMLTRLVVLLRP